MKKLLSPSKTLTWMRSVCNPASNNQNKQARCSSRGWSSRPKVSLLWLVKWYKKIKPIKRAKKDKRSSYCSGACWEWNQSLVRLRWACSSIPVVTSVNRHQFVCWMFLFVPLFWQKTVWFSPFFLFLYIWRLGFRTLQLFYMCWCR